MYFLLTSYSLTTCLRMFLLQALPPPPDAAEVDVLCAGRVLTATPSLTTPTLSLTLILSLSLRLTLTPTLALTLTITLTLTRCPPPRRARCGPPPPRSS